MSVELLFMLISIIATLVSVACVFVARHAEREAHRHADNAWNLAESVRGRRVRLQDRAGRPS